MEVPSQSQMVRLMPVRSGYTLLEMLLCMAVLSALSLITMGNVSLEPSEVLYLEEINQLVLEARSAAILLGEEVSITFENKRITNGLTTVKLSKAYMAITGRFTYNGNGHIEKGGTVRFCQHHCYDLIFNVGNGAYRIEKN